MGTHQQSIGINQEWLTPPEIIKSLGRFDLDPCAPIVRPWETAKVHYTIEDDGLLKPWKNIEHHTTITNHEWQEFPCTSYIKNPRVWLNPPYDRRVIDEWMRKMGEHGNGISLIFARTDTNTFQKCVFGYASSILFMQGRITFYTVEGKKGHFNGGAPSVLVAYGDNNSQAIAESGIKGTHLPVNTMPIVVVGISPSWRSVITIAVNRNNGEADMETIYSLVETIAPDKCANNPNFKAKIRQQLQYHFTNISKGIWKSTK